MKTEDAVNFEFGDAGKPQVSYLICSVPRTGSTLLCDLLFGTGVAGAPTELFHPDYMRRLRRRWGAETTEDYVQQLLARKTGPNGVFGAKAHWGQYQQLFEQTDPRAVLPHLRLIFMTRRDRLRQAVSWVRALQTMRWHSIHPEQKERPPEFDLEHITRKLARIGREEDEWRTVFERYGIEPLDIVYEDLVSDPARILRETLEFLGIEVPPNLEVAQPTLERQADELSEHWVERYLAETAHT